MALGVLVDLPVSLSLTVFTLGNLNRIVKLGAYFVRRHWKTLNFFRLAFSAILI